MTTAGVIGFTIPLFVVTAFGAVGDKEGVVTLGSGRAVLGCGFGFAGPTGSNVTDVSICANSINEKKSYGQL